jgi:hypothetical protein
MVPGEPEQLHRAGAGSLARLPQMVVQNIRAAGEDLAGPFPTPIDEQMRNGRA